ncbi:MAG TPA: hypothetical protein VGC41_19980, partial [Kofleriaceae bacterium]
MASCIAIISKAVFEKQAAGTGEGDVVALAEYAATPKQLDVLGDGDALFLVTVRPPDERLWLVAVLESPTKGKGGWTAAVNTRPITDLAAVKAKLQFANGKPLPTEKGKLGMSLQTPRVLTEDDVALLRAGMTRLSASTRKVATSRATAKPAIEPAAKPTTKPTTKPAKPAKPLTHTATSAIANASTGTSTILAATKTGDAGAVLVAALEVWRANKNETLADFIDEVGARLGAAPVTDQAALTKLARGKDPRNLGVLLASVTAVQVSFLPVLGDLIADFPDDPRIATAFVGWM